MKSWQLCKNYCFTNHATSSASKFNSSRAIYHTIAEREDLQTLTEDHALSGFWIYRAVLWLEKNVRAGKLPRHDPQYAYLKWKI